VAALSARKKFKNALLFQDNYNKLSLICCLPAKAPEILKHLLKEKIRYSLLIPIYWMLKAGRHLAFLKNRPALLSITVTVI
jgi:hypothetical protein